MTDQGYRPTPGENDPMLEGLVFLVEGLKGFEVGITLTVRGAVITGKLIGTATYMEAVADAWAAVVGGGEAGSEIKRTFVESAEDLRKALKVDREEREKSDKPTRTPAYIHLKGAQIVTGTNIYPQSGMLWRGKIREVEGFSLGTLSVGYP